MARRNRRAQRSGGVSGVFEFFRLLATEWAADVRVLLGRTHGLGNTGDAEEDQEAAEEVEILQPLGFVARPKPDQDDDEDGHELVVVRLGDELYGIGMVNKKLAKLAEADLDKGEVMMHGACTDNIAAYVRIKKEGDIVIFPKDGKKLYLGGEEDAQKALMGEETRDYLKDDVKPAVNNLRSDMTSVSTHTHNGTAGPYPVSTIPSTSLTSIPGGSALGDPPENSSIVYTR